MKLGPTVWKRARSVRRSAARLFAVLCACTLLASAQSAPLSTASGSNQQVGSVPATQNVIVPPAITAYLGLNVSSITFRGLHEDSQVRTGLLDLIPQKAGEPLDRSNIRQSIQRLYATGRFAEIAVEAARGTNHDAALTFAVKENYFVGAVTVTGAPKRPPANQLINASKLQLGELYTPQVVEQALRSMRSVLADNGWYKATVTAKENLNPEAQIADIHFYVERGEQARIGKIIVTGSPGFSPSQVQDIAKMHPGDRVSAEAVTRALTRLRKKYQKSDRLEAQVSIVDRQYHPDSNRLDYTFKIDRGPIVDIKVEGAKLREGVLKKYVPVYEENAVDDDLLNEGRRNLRDYFQTKGYFDVKVDFKKEVDPKTDHTTVVYVIDRGERHTLSQILVDGNRYFNRDTILERMSVRGASGLLTHGRYSQTLLSRDLQSIEALYKANGFRDVKVTSDVRDDVNGKSGVMEVAVHIVEGPQVRVNSLRIEGNKAIEEDEIRGQITTAEGQPFSEANISTDRDLIVNYYFNRGFPDVQFETFATPSPQDPTKMDVRFVIREGAQVIVDRIRVAGLNFTKPFVVNREFQIHDNDPLSQNAMLDTQRRLYDLGIFNEVDVAIQNPDGQAKFKDLLFEMREARRWTFNYGVGFEVQTGGAPKNVTELNTSPGPGVDVPSNSTPPTNTVLRNPDQAPTFSPRFSFEFTRLNFRGRDHTVTFRSHISRLQQRGLISYEAPRWFDKPNLRLTFSTFYDNSRDVRTFTARRLEGSVQADQQLSKVTTLLYRLQYRRVSVDANSLAISPALIPTLSRPIRVGIPSFTYIRDKRNDPLESTTGNYTTFDVGVATKAFGSQTNFSRFLAQNSTYIPFRRTCTAGECTSWVIARMTRIGVEEPFGRQPTEATDIGTAGLRNPIPLPERFFGGGGNSHRGFALNQAGPRDLTTGFPVGGNAIFVNSIEVRTPPVELPFVQNNLSFVLFHDFGNVFESGQEMVKGIFRLRQRNRGLCEVESTSGACDFTYSAHALGVGARYRTPIGPVRVDLSYTLNPPVFPFFVQCAPIPTDSKGNPKTVHGLCGNAPNEVHFPAGTQIFQTGTLRRINFFFSIGQTF